LFTRVFELRREIEQFLGQRIRGIAERFENEKIILSLEYLADIFSHLNELNTSMQGTGMNMITSQLRKGYFPSPTNFQSGLVALDVATMLIFHNFIKFPM